MVGVTACLAFFESECKLSAHSSWAASPGACVRVVYQKVVHSWRGVAFLKVNAHVGAALVTLSARDSHTPATDHHLLTKSHVADYDLVGQPAGAQLTCCAHLLTPNCCQTLKERSV